MALFLKRSALYFILILSLFGCKKEKTEGYVRYLTCDAEDTRLVYLKGSDGTLLTGGQLQTSDQAHSGKYSVMLDNENRYAFQVKFEDLKADMFVRATIWKKGKTGNLAFTSSKDLDYKYYSRIILNKEENGWEQIILEAFVPANYKGEEIKLFAMSDGSEAVFFDDLEISVYTNKVYPAYSEINNIDIIIDEEYIQEIEKNRVKSFTKGVISKKTKQSYPAIFNYNGKSIEAEVRIKGDWLDHIQGDKWSFRIKLLEGNFMGMREFSIQQPGARGYMHEYVIHKLFYEEDVLTTKYGFVPVKVNGNGKGIYAYEEHFAKHLIESRDRREGPILKFDESALWTINRENLSREGNFISGPMVESAIITPFKKGKTTKNPTLKGNFEIAQNLLNQYRMDTSPISELFKTDKLAKFYSIVNIGRTWHTTRWHNERFYYDPISSKMEIIAYDCYTTSDMENLPVLLAPEVIDLDPNFNYDKYLGYSPFNDKKFLLEYISVMDYYMNSNRLDSILQMYQTEINDYTELIKKEYSFYSYDSKFISEAVIEVKQKWTGLKEKFEDEPTRANLIIDNYSDSFKDPIEGMSLQAFVKTPYQLHVQNFFSDKLYLLAYSSKKLPEQGIVTFDIPIEFEAYTSLENLNFESVETAFPPTKIYYKTSLEDSIVYDIKAMNWPMPELDSPRQKLLRKSVKSSNSLVSVNDSLILFKKGKHKINYPLIIAEGKKVIMEDGVYLDFVEKAFFMSFSPVYIQGKEGSPVIIESSDGSAMGFTTIDAKGRSKLDQVVFRGFNTLSFEGWNLTGAVTFYQSDVDIVNTVFLNNNCEDGLNIVRSDFSMKTSMISGAFSDGFDADFATGIVEGSTFKQIGNDGLDFSGSRIEIKDVRIKDVGDKGISGGESSTLYLENIDVRKASIGLASKDRSIVIGRNVSIKDSHLAFAVYQKKTEYEPARMEIENVQLNGIEREDLLGQGSILILDEKERVGVEKLNIDSLYGL